MQTRENHGCLVQEIELFSGKRYANQGVQAGDSLTVRFQVQIADEIMFDLTFRLSFIKKDTGEVVYRRHMDEDGWDISWLPRGHYTVEWRTARLFLSAGSYKVELEAAAVPNGHYHRFFSVAASNDLVVEGESVADASETTSAWTLSNIEGLNWKKGKDNWFYKHFEHAARVIMHYMLDDSLLLSGKILDVGCGDGITDLGIFLRKRPELLVGLDMEDNFRELPRMMRESGLPFDSWPENLVFRQVDANQIPYPDDYFDVVLSWGSLEHIAGGYRQTLKEIKRVLKDGGLFFLHPGLYYSSSGHHIGEFSPEPFVHLKESPAELKEIVFTAQPRYMDRGGLVYAPADFWRYYSELNKITVSQLERELRMLNFEFKKVAAREEDLVTYTPELQKYSIQDLTTREIYMTVVNRKTLVSAQREGSAERAANAPVVGSFDYSHYEMQCKDRQWNRELLGEYLPYFASCRKVLDLACGSGIFLEMLAENGIPVVGVERNKTVVEWGLAQGWEIVQQDAFEFLAQSQNTYDGIFCSHFLEHLPFDKVLQLVELILPRLEPAGTLVLVFPNPESLRMQLFGFWRDPEHVRFYHPELIETVCRHYGFEVLHTNRKAIPFAFPPPAWEELGLQENSEARIIDGESLRAKVRNAYLKVLRMLRLVPRADLVALEERLRQERIALRRVLAPWTAKTSETINEMWAWADNAMIVCRKPEP